MRRVSGELVPGKIEGEGVRLEADEDVVYQERRRTNVDDDLEEVRKRLRVCYAQRTNFMYIVHKHCRHRKWSRTWRCIIHVCITVDSVYYLAFLGLSS